MSESTSSSSASSATAPASAAAQPPLDIGQTPPLSAPAADDPKVLAFYAQHQAFVVQNCAGETTKRGEELLLSSNALRVLVNTHFEVQRRNLARINAEIDAKRRPGAEPHVPICVFSEPLVVWSAKSASGQWLAVRKLSLKLAADAALVDQRTLELANDMAKNGVLGFVLLLEALEQTTLRIAARSMFVVKVQYLASRIDSARALPDLTACVNELSKFTKLQLVTTTTQVEDVHRRFAVVRAAEKSGVPSVSTAFEPGTDTPAMATAKYSKYTSDASLNECLREQQLAAAAFQSFELSQQQTRLLNYVLVQYPGIIEQIKRNRAAGFDQPTIVAVNTRSAQLVEEFGVAWCSVGELEKDMRERQSAKQPVDRNRRLLEVVNDRTKRDCGADAVVFEIIDSGRGLAFGNQLHYVNYFGDILAMEQHVLAERTTMAKAEQEKRSEYEKLVDAAPKNRFEPSDAETARAATAIVAKRDRTVDELTAEWNAERARLDKLYQEAIKAAAPQPPPAATTGTDAPPPPSPQAATATVATTAAATAASVADSTQQQ